MGSNDDFVIPTDKTNAMPYQSPETPDARPQPDHAAVLRSLAEDFTWIEPNKIREDACRAGAEALRQLQTQRAIGQPIGDILRERDDALRRVKDLEEKINLETQDYHIFQCDVASALGWGLPENEATGMKAGELFVDAIRRLREEGEDALCRARQSDETVRLLGHELDAARTIMKSEADAAEEFARKLAAALAIVAERDKRIAELRARLTARKCEVKQLQKACIINGRVIGLGRKDRSEYDKLRQRIAELESVFTAYKTKVGSYAGWMIVEECEDGSMLLDNLNTGDRRRVWDTHIERIAELEAELAKREQSTLDAEGYHSEDYDSSSAYITGRILGGGGGNATTQAKEQTDGDV